MWIPKVGGAEAPGDLSRLAGLQDSIDEPKCLRKSILAPKSYFGISYGVDRRVDAIPEPLELARPEHEPADGRLAAAEDEVVRAEARELDLRLLDREEVLHGLRQRAVPIFERRLQLAQLVLRLRKRESPVHVDAQRLGSDVLLRHERIDARVDADGPRRDAVLALQFRHGFVQQLDVELEADRRDVAGLLGAEQLTGAADLEVAHRDREAGTELGVVGERR